MREFQAKRLNFRQHIAQILSFHFSKQGVLCGNMRFFCRQIDEDWRPAPDRIDTILYT